MQRSNLRGDIDFTVIEKEPDGFKYRYKGLNISTTGVRVLRAGVLKHDPNEVVDLEIHLPNVPHPIKVKASSVWMEQDEHGMKFVEISDSDRLTLAEALDELAKQGGELR